VKLSLSQSEASSPSWLDQELAGKLRRIAASIEDTDHPVDVILVDDNYIRGINRDFRGHDSPTDVISFSYINDIGSALAGDDLAGEIYVSYETLEREANSQAIAVKNLFLRIGVHGLLHVVGYDHDTEADTERMEQEERRLLGDEMTASEVDELF
jgi:probable rRNA maturation factor